MALFRTRSIRISELQGKLTVAVEKQQEDTARVEAIEVRLIPHRTHSAILESIHRTLELMGCQDIPSGRIEAEN